MDYVRCNLCDSDEPVRIKDSPLVRCKRCGLVYVNPRAAGKELDKQYSPEYYREVFDQEYTTEDQIERQIGRNARRAEEIVRRFGRRGRLLDIGCGQGFFLACIKRYGWDAVGIDISDWAIQFAGKRLGLEVYRGSVEDLHIEGSFNVVTMYHILEHLRDPLSSLRKVSQLLTGNGTLIIEGPNYASFDRIWHGRYWRGFADSSHLFYFTPDTYRAALERAGFSVKKMKFQYWDPAIHLLEAGFSDGIRADHNTETLKELSRRINRNIALRILGGIMYNISRGLRLRGRDLTIYAKREGS